MLTIFAHSFMTATRTDAQPSRGPVPAKAAPRPRRRFPMSLWMEGGPAAKEPEA